MTKLRLAMCMALCMPSMVMACDLSNHFVGTTRFDNLPIQDAVNKLVRGTPFRVVFSDDIPAKRINARDVSGRLDRVLSALAKKTGTTYAQEGCTLVFRSGSQGSSQGQLVAGQGYQKGPSAENMDTRWVLEAGRPLHVQLKEWADRAGWHLEWSLKTSWIVPAPSAYSGSFEQAIESVIQSLYAQGKPIRLNVWEGNRLMEVVSHDVR